MGFNRGKANTLIFASTPGPGAVTMLSRPVEKSLDCCHAVSSLVDLKFKMIVHMSLCLSGGMISLLIKPGNLARAASCRAFHAAKASSLPARTFAVAIKAAGELIYCRECSTRLTAQRFGRRLMAG